MLGTLLRSYCRTKFRTFNSRKSLEIWQEKQVIRHLKKILSCSPFYQGLYKGLKLASWKTFPIITKKEMMENFDTLNTAGIQRDEAFHIAMKAEETRLFNSEIGDITIGLSSGTSGSHGLFLVNSEERSRWAGAVLAKCLPRFILFPERISLFMRANSSLYTSIRSKVIQFEYHDLLSPLEKHISQLNHFKPSILVAPPSMLRQLADELQKGRLLIHPQKIISIAELLDPIDERYISSHFNQKVHQIYQATEGFLATTCAHGTLHFNEDIMVIQKEIIDEEKGLFYPIITDFTRFSQPIIRYRLNDVLAESKCPCPCGSTFTALRSIEGRADDLFYFPNYNQKLMPVYPDFIRRAIIMAHPGIEEYLVIQKSSSHVDIALKGPADQMYSIQTMVQRRFAHLAGELHFKMPFISFISYTPLKQGKKLRRIERRYQPGV